MPSIQQGATGSVTVSAVGSGDTTDSWRITNSSSALIANSTIGSANNGYTVARGAHPEDNVTVPSGATVATGYTLEVQPGYAQTGQGGKYQGSFDITSGGGGGGGSVVTSGAGAALLRRR